MGPGAGPDSVKVESFCHWLPTQQHRDCARLLLSVSSM